MKFRVLILPDLPNVFLQEKIFSKQLWRRRDKNNTASETIIYLRTKTEAHCEIKFRQGELQEENANNWIVKEYHEQIFLYEMHLWKKYFAVLMGKYLLTDSKIKREKFCFDKWKTAPPKKRSKEHLQPNILILRI